MSIKFRAILNEIAALEEKKASDYGTPTDPFASVRGSAGYGIAPWIGCAWTADKKLSRIKSQIANGALANEPVRDALIDGAVYLLLAACLFDEESPKVAPAPAARNPVPHRPSARRPGESEVARRMRDPSWRDSAPRDGGSRSVQVETLLGGNVVNVTDATRGEHEPLMQSGEVPH